MTSVARVPTGEIDRIVTVAVDWTAAVPLLVITSLGRKPDEVSDQAFKPVHTITLQTQFAELLVVRIRAALVPPMSAPGEGDRP